MTENLDFQVEILNAHPSKTAIANEFVDDQGDLQQVEASLVDAQPDLPPSYEEVMENQV